MTGPGPRAAAATLLYTALWAIPMPARPIVDLCVFHRLTGRPCPLCGITRGVFALAKGDWSAALSFNALAPLGFLMLFALFFNGRARGWLWTWGVAAFAVYGVWRLF